MPECTPDQCVCVPCLTAKIEKLKRDLQRERDDNALWRGRHEIAAYAMSYHSDTRLRYLRLTENVAKCRSCGQLTSIPDVQGQLCLSCGFQNPHRS